MYLSVQHGLALTYVPYGKKKGLSLTFVALCTTRLSADIRYVPYCTTRFSADIPGIYIIVQEGLALAYVPYCTRGLNNDICTLLYNRA